MRVQQDRVDNGQYWDKAWSLVHGCRPRSTECLNCWAAQAANMRQHNPNEAVAERHKGIITDRKFNGRANLDYGMMNKPLETRKSWTYSVWDDLFYGDGKDQAWCWQKGMVFRPVPTDFINEAFEVMALAAGHAYIVLTKRAERMSEWASTHKIPSNAVMGVTAGVQGTADARIAELVKVKAMRMVSVEPLLAPLDLGEWLAPPEYTGVSYMGMSEMVAGEPLIDWVVLGCETIGNGRIGRLGTFKTQSKWMDGAIDVVTQCKEAEVPVFVKQVPRLGKAWVEKDIRRFPKELRLRELPTIRYPMVDWR